MARAFDTADRNTLPPLTRAIVNTYRPKNPGSNFGGPLDPVFTTEAFSALIDAVHALENRVIALET